MSPTDERTWGTIAHGGTLAATILSGGTLGFVCALVIYLLYKDRGPFVHHHSANALNVQIFGAILVIGGIILTVTVIGAIIGIPMIIVGGLVRADRAPHRRHQGQQRRVVEPADDAPVRQVS